MSNHELTLYKKIEATTGFDFYKIPERTRKLLYISGEEPRSSSCGMSISITFDSSGSAQSKLSGPADPSTIYTSLPIFIDGHVQEAAPPSYYPSYSGLNPFQRRVYLEWLQNPASSVDIGYVFIYYYGLERHLVEGEFDLAFDEILLLREHHPRIRSYSTTPLIMAAFLRNRLDRLESFLNSLPVEDIPINYLIMTAFHSSRKMDTKALTNLIFHIRGFNRRYFRERLLLFEQTLEQILIERYGEPFLPFPDGFPESVPKEHANFFCNRSISFKFRHQEVPFPIDDEQLILAIKALLEETNARIKLYLQKRRKHTKRRDGQLI